MGSWSHRYDFYPGCTASPAVITTSRSKLSWAQFCAKPLARGLRKNGAYAFFGHVASEPSQNPLIDRKMITVNGLWKAMFSRHPCPKPSQIILNHSKPWVKMILSFGPRTQHMQRSETSMTHQVVPNVIQIVSRGGAAEAARSLWKDMMVTHTY